MISWIEKFDNLIARQEFRAHFVSLGQNLIYSIGSSYEERNDFPHESRRNISAVEK